jgi:anti-anti-sigma regulatory factor
MLKISRAATTDAIVLRLEGQVVGPWVTELESACHDASHSNGRGALPLILDLQGVSFLDADGIALLRQLVTGGASLTNYSVFLAEQLKEVADGDR